MSLNDLLGPLAALPSFSWSPAPAAAAAAAAATPAKPAAPAAPAAAAILSPVRLDPPLHAAPPPPPPPTPIRDLVYRRDALLSSTPSLCTIAAGGHQCSSDTCHIIAHPTNPTVMICAQSGLIHRCLKGCMDARKSERGVCPISGLYWSEYREIEEANAKYDDRYGMARQDAHDPVAQILKHVHVKQPVADEAQMKRIYREAHITTLVCSVVRDLLFSTHRKQHDAERLGAARTKLSNLLAASLRTNADLGRYGISLVWVKQQVEYTVQALVRDGQCFIGDTNGEEAAEAEAGIQSFAKRCAEKWVELEVTYARDEEEDKEDADAAAAAAAAASAVDGKEKKKESQSSLMQRHAARRPPQLTIGNLMYSFTYHVLATLYRPPPLPQQLAALLPSESYLSTRFAARRFKLHKALAL